jgi:predicted nucleotidyltransferase
MSFQSLFQRFHETIRLKRPNENATLVEKRDRVLKRLNDNLSISFTPFNQGSYAMSTGIKPVNDGSDYDIDVAIVLDINPRNNDPVEVKRLVYEAVYGHTSDVEWRRPCITVNYHRAGDVLCHVDLAILAKDPYSGTLYLAIGKEHSSRNEREWQPDDRKGFMEAVKNRFDGEDAVQFRRVIRYLKRWKDVHFASEGRAAPSGLSLTVAAFHWFQPMKASYYSTEYDDLSATANLVHSIRQRFGQVVDRSLNRYVPRLSLQFPTVPRDDVFERMTNQQMLEFHQRLENLSGWLEDARRTNTITPLRRAFGKDFPEQ